MMDRQWHWIKVSQDTKRMIDSRVRPGYEVLDTGRTTADGDYEFPIDDEIYQWLNENRFPGESDNDCLSRLMAGKQS